MVDVEPAYGGEEVGPEREVGAVAALQDEPDLREGLRNEGVDVVGRHQQARQTARGVGVAGGQLGVRVGVAGTRRRDEFGVAECLGSQGEDGSHVYSTLETSTS